MVGRCSKDEKKLIVTMKKASRLMIIGNTNKGDQTTDHYSMMGFTKLIMLQKKIAVKKIIIKNEKKKRKIVLAYSGGLDTSIILKWLQEKYKAEVIAYTSDIGQKINTKKILANAKKKLGVKKIIIENLKNLFVKEYIYPMIRGHAIYEGVYLLGTSIARPLIAKRQIAIAKKYGAYAVSHGSTGKGNDQVRFELAYHYFAPKIKVIAPWRIWKLNSRTDLLK